MDAVLRSPCPLLSLVVVLGLAAPPYLFAANPTPPSETDTAARVDAALLRDLAPDARCLPRWTTRPSCAASRST